MKCPHCETEKKSGVLDTRLHGEDIARRRECSVCGERFWTRERVDTAIDINRLEGSENRRKTPERKPERASNSLWVSWK